jgi:transcriptional regulator with GAF, ATPase, and Fis domain
LGEGCRGQMAPFLDTTSVMRRSAKEELESEDRRKRTVQKRHDLLSQVSVALKDNKPLEEILRSVLVHVFSYLKRIDRGAFVLVEPGTLVVEKTICLSAKRRGEATHPYSEKVARKVLSTGKPLVFSKVCTENEEGLVDTLKLQKIESVLCVPLMNGSQVLGIMYIDSMKRPDGFRKDDLLDLLDIGQRVALSVQKERISLDVLKIATTLSEESQE